MTGEKMRVYEIAKEVGIPNKDLIAKIRALGLEVNNHMSSLDADDVARIKRSLEKEKAGGEKPAQTQRMATGGAVLRRRSAADKAADGAESQERPAVPAAPPAPAPVIRRRPVAEEAPAPARVEAAPPPAPAVIKRTPPPAPAPVVEAPPPPVAQPEAREPVETRPAAREKVAAEPSPAPVEAPVE